MSTKERTEPGLLDIGDDTPVVALPRRTVDKLLVGTGIVATVVFLIAGALLSWGAGFSNDYVRDELSVQQIFFPPEEALREEGRDDLVKFAGQQVTTGEHAEAYASFIEGHIEAMADGMRYAEFGQVETAAREAVAAAEEAGASEAEIAELQEEATAATRTRDSLFKGETLRGLLLSSYAWHTIGRIAGIAATAAFVAAFAMAILVILGIVQLAKGDKPRT
ncbi:MAG: hypothetical protein GX643_01730 [Acidimicrobiales bacterium]|nr:hypothetical protein [Acidimicrobiales bacterium]